MLMPSQPPAEKSSTDITPSALLDIIQQLALELHPHSSTMRQPTLESSLERDLGFDSLGRMEILVRLERTFDVRLAEQAVAIAETSHDLLRALQEATTFAATVSAQTVHSPVPATIETTPETATTLLEVLIWHVAHHPERRHLTLYNDSDHGEDLTYGDLYQGALSVAAGLQERHVQSGQTVALMLPTSRDFFYGFFGILLAGGMPVPLYPPARPSQLEEHLRRQIGILTNARAVAMITVPQAQPLARLLRAQITTLRHVVTVSELTATAAPYTQVAVQTHDLAFVQYTSGSTGQPKGVMLTHANLLANLRIMGQRVHITAADVFVSWLPLYHDMGLIGAWLGSLYYAYPLVLMSPLAFLARPARWLWAIHTHRGTISAGPNFAYELCVRKLDDRDLVGLDLSSWRLAFNGAEPVSASTITRFSERLAPYGFRPEAMKPVYGLAEVSLGLAFPPVESPPQVDRIKRQPFMRSGSAEPAPDADPTALPFVACGQPLPGYQVRIVDTAGFEVGERQEGRLEFQGPSATRGYLHHPEATRQLFRGDWLDSGDMAYMVGNTLYLTGRAKDIIIRAGRNIYPHELEEALNSIAGLRQGCTAVFGSPDPVSGTERLIILAETRTTDPAALEALRINVASLATDLLGTPPDDVVLAPPHSVLKTSSGKIRRAASRERYERGDIGQRQHAVWWQIVRLAASSIRPQLRRSRQQTMSLLYGGYFWGLSGIGFLSAWTLVALLPRRTWRQWLVRLFARGLLRLSSIPIQLEGLQHLPPRAPYIIVANHASYLDGFILTAVLPVGTTYVVKRELRNFFVARLLLQRLGAIFVERSDVQRGVEDTEHILHLVRQGQTMVFFPEGTFRRTPGLRPFHLGAFLVAAQAGVPVVPLGIRGTRSILRDGQWLPRRGQLYVTIAPPLVPKDSDWAAVLALRDAARQRLARLCGEPELDIGSQDT